MTNDNKTQPQNNNKTDSAKKPNESNPGRYPPQQNTDFERRSIDLTKLKKKQ